MFWPTSLHIVWKTSVDPVKWMPASSRCFRTALEISEAEPLPRRRVIERLIAQKLVAEVRVVAPEVDRLARGVDLGLVHRLRLTEHRGRVDRVSPRPREQRRRAKEHRRTFVVGGRCPHLA